MNYIFDLNKYLESIELTEMARTPREIREKLDDSLDQRIENLMQIFIFNNETNNHWMNELYACCHETFKCRSGNKYLPKKDILDVLWNSWEDCYNDWLPGILGNICYKENLTELPDFNCDNAYLFMRDYHLWLAKELSHYGKISMNDCKNEVLRLLNIYER